MKELSIKEKAKAYDEAIERAKRLYNDGNSPVAPTIEGIFPELKESKDERIRKYIISSLNALLYIKGSQADKERNDAIAWLEKQCEQKSIDSLTQQEAMDIAVAKCFNDQKPADRVEPKFKIGEWVFIEEVKGYKSGPFQIKTVDSFGYSFDEYHTIPFMYEELLSKWTIKDAKEGDVLAVEPLKDYPSPFIAIYKERGLDYFNSYCFIGFDGKFYTGDTGHDITDIHPATKEQCAQLEKAMTDAGYAFDFEKKELKKIEQKSAEWSEEDEEYMSSALRMIEHCGFTAIGGLSKGAVIDWLKSLRPQNKWKPSDEQMKALHDLNVTGGISYAGQEQELINLYNELKKL